MDALHSVSTVDCFPGYYGTFPNVDLCFSRNMSTVLFVSLSLLQEKVTQSREVVIERTICKDVGNVRGIQQGVVRCHTPSRGCNRGEP